MKKYEESEVLPMYHTDIMVGDDKVLYRQKFHFREESIQLVLKAIKEFGVEAFPLLNDSPYA